MDNKDKPEEIKTPESQDSAERAPEIEMTPVPEKKEAFSEDKIVADELRREIEMMELDDNLKDEARKKAQKIEFLGEKEKIEHLLDVAREKGVVFAVNMARETKDPYLLDIFHDILAKEGYYRTFSKKDDD